MKTKWIVLLAIIIALMVAIGLALRFTPLGDLVMGEAKIYKADNCATEIEQYCADKQGKQLMRCFKMHFSKYNQSCKTNAIAIAERRGGCTADRYRFCETMLIGTVNELDSRTHGDGLLKCYLEHRQVLTPACGAKVDSLAICQEDIRKHCGDVEVGGGRIGKCLFTNRGDLSQECKDSVGF